MRNLIFFFFIVLSPVVTFAQDEVTGVGDIKSVATKGNQLEITTSHAFVQVSVYTSSVIRIRMSNHPFSDDFSYAVVSHPISDKLRMAQTDYDVQVVTDSLKLVIGKKPFNISFYTPNGKLINADETSLSTSWIGNEVTTYKTMQEGERFVGLGEKTGNLDKRGNAYTNWNVDAYGYNTGQDPLYSTIPFYIGIHHDIEYGIFLDNTFQSDFNFGASNNRFSSFGARGGEMNYYFIYQTSVAGIIRSYTQLTGRMPLPPLWSLGYQQNRYSYFPDAEVYRVAETLREKKIPADGITLDIHYMDAYKLFTWDKDRFPDPKAMIDSLSRLGFKLSVIVDPGIKVENNYPAYESGLKANIFIKYTDGQNYTGQVWPGWCNFPDFLSEKGRNWWKSQITNYTNIGVAGIWNDMNEIATWGQKMPNNVVFNYDNHPTTHLKGHNVYGLEMARSSYEAARESLLKRPFVLTRAGYAGLQRYTAIWTGDNRAEDDHMLAGVRLLQGLGLSGVSFTGMDIGGFTGNPTAGLYARWMQLGAFIPYFRNHTALNTKSAEPWSFGEDVLDIVRNYINLRYKLLPYLYSTFYESTQDGLPVLRSLAIDYPHDEKIYSPVFQNQYLFGHAFLVIPQESVQRFAKIYLPEGEWYNLYTDTIEKGNTEKLIELSPTTLPVYVKGGSIVPMQSLVQHTSEKPTDTLTLHVFRGLQSRDFDYYEDDGETYQYEQGAYFKRTIHFDPVNKTIILDKAMGKSSSKFHFIRIALHGFGEAVIMQNGIALNTKPYAVSIVSSVKSFDVRSVVLENKTDAINLKY